MSRTRLHLSLPRAERPPLFRAEMKVSLALSAALTVIGTVAFLRGPEIIDLIRPSSPDRAPSIAAAPAIERDSGTDAVEAIRIARIDAPGAEAPALARPGWPNRRPRVETLPPAPRGDSALAVARSMRPELRPAAPVALAEAEAVEEALETEVIAGLARSPLPRARPAQLAARRSLQTAVDAAIGADALATRRAPAPEALATPEAEVQTVAFETTPAPRRGGSDACSSRLARDIPRRSPTAPSGSRLVQQLGGSAGGERDRLFSRELLAGNMPGFLRQLTPVSITGKRGDGQQATVTICVTPDYLAVGSDSDYFRVPLSLPAAALVADRFGFMLPTTRMVDAIFQQAGTRVAPSPMTPGAAMTSTNYFWRHNQTVEGQLRGRAGTLVAGIKKDLVLSERLRRNPGRVAIYGWHRTNGTPIQPLSTVHGAYYADYSHGVRLVSRTAYVDGRAVALADILSDPNYAGFLSNEGPIQSPDLLMAALYR